MEMELDDAATRRLQMSARRVAILAAFGTVLVGGFIAAALIDPEGMTPATNADPSPGWLAWTTAVLTIGVALLIVARFGLIQLRRQRRTLARSAFVRLPAQWAPMRVRRQSVPGIRAVVRAPGATVLLSARPKKVVAEPPPDPSAPRNAIDTDTVISWAFLAVMAVSVIVQTVLKGDFASVGGAGSPCTCW